VTSRNSSDSTAAAPQHPPLSNGNHTHSTWNVLAVGKDSSAHDGCHAGDGRRGRVFTSLADLRIDAELRRIRSRTKRKAEPCAVCSSTSHVVAHHHSYFEPQSLIYLCRSHHKRLHVRLGKRGRDPVDLYYAGRLAGRPAPFEGREWTTEEAYAVHVARYEASSRRMKALYAHARGA
jgi:hypothetical protein